MACASSINRTCSASTWYHRRRVYWKSLLDRNSPLRPICECSRALYSQIHWFRRLMRHRRRTQPLLDRLHLVKRLRPHCARQTVDWNGKSADEMYIKNTKQRNQLKLMSDWSILTWTNASPKQCNEWVPMACCGWCIQDTISVPISVCTRNIVWHLFLSIPLGHHSRPFRFQSTEHWLSSTCGSHGYAPVDYLTHLAPA